MTAREEGYIRPREIARSAKVLVVDIARRAFLAGIYISMCATRNGGIFSPGPPSTLFLLFCRAKVASRRITKIFSLYLPSRSLYTRVQIRRPETNDAERDQRGPTQSIPRAPFPESEVTSLTMEGRAVIKDRETP